MRRTFCEPNRVKIMGSTNIEKGVHGSGPRAAQALWMRILFGKRPLITLIRAAIFGSILYVTGRFFYTPTTLQGVSMEPTYADGSFNIIDRRAFFHRTPERGDVVVIQPRVSVSRNYYLKRILALPGETLSFQNGQLYLNGKEQPEPYLTHKGDWTTYHDIRVGPDEFWVSGDNRLLSINTQGHGLTKHDRIIGSLLIKKEKPKVTIP